MHISNQLSSTLVLCVFMKSVSTAPDPLITAKPAPPTAAQLQYRRDDTGPNVYGYIGGDVSK